ncbi:hypothetical protein GOD90_20235 [Sinorhizobium medicae]|nr:hypothetical protein [Sinorhizobium medicae]MDX0899285.1 hypothetical protein [Sinorhizobium medicae]MDX1242716.1 hypothetical protein [Sinorhizobium medicae]
MIRFRRITLQPLQQWIPAQTLPAPQPGYRLRVWREVNANLAPLQDELIDYAQEALDDARQKIRRGLFDPLSPFADDEEDPAANYPAVLHRVTLQGYLGETLAGLAIEHFGAFDAHDWHIPAFLFRMHDTEFQHLDLINEHLKAGGSHDPDVEAELRPGRTGDDAIAFRVDENGRISHVLTLEAKCIGENNTTTIRKAHEKLSIHQDRPSGVRELINLLSDYDTPEAEEWQTRLLAFWKEGFKKSQRSDGLAYAVGHYPKKNPTQVSWLPVNQPHEAYTGGRPLEAMEFQLADIAGLVDILYRSQTDG